MVYSWFEEKLIQNSKIRYLNIPPNVFQGTETTEVRQKIYISWMSLYFSFTTVFLTYFANKLIFSMDYFTSNGLLFSFLLVCISGCLFFSLGFCYVWNYLIKKDMTLPQIKNFQQFRDLWAYITGCFLSILLFLVVWPLLQIFADESQWIIYPLLVNLILAVGLLYTLISLKIVPAYGKRVLKIFLVFLLALLVEELLRSFTGLSILFRISLPCVMFTFLNRKEINNSLLAVLMLVVYICGFTGIFIEVTQILLPNISIFDRILAVVFVFTIICSLMIRSLANLSRIQKYANTVQRLQMGNQIKFNTIISAEIAYYLPEIPFYIKIFNNPKILRTISLIWQLILPIFLFAPLTKIFHWAMNFVATVWWRHLVIDFSIFLWVLIAIQWIAVVLFMFLKANRYNRLHQLRSQFEDFNLFPTKHLKTFTILLYTVGSMILGIYIALLGSQLSPVILVTLIVLGISIGILLMLSIWEAHINKVLSKRLVDILTLITLFVFGISSYFLITVYLQHWFTVIYIFAYFAALKHTKYSQLIHYLPIYQFSVLGMYLSILGIISYYIWILIPWNFAIILIAGLLYLTVLLESKGKFLKELISNYILLKISTWTLFCLASLFTGVFLLYPVFKSYQIIGALIIFSFELMYLLNLMDSIHFMVDPSSNLYSKLKKSLVYANYLQVVAVIFNFLVLGNLQSIEGYFDSIPLTRMILISEMLLVVYLITVIDYKFIKSINQSLIRHIELVCFVVLVISGALDMGYWLFFIADLPSISPTPTPGPSGEFNFALLSQIM
ncbi:MAG: hypothetical protein E4G98_03725, partial [Promethearchaeota archaeon]